MSQNDETPESDRTEPAEPEDVAVSDERADDPEIPVADAVEQHTPLTEDDPEEDLWRPVPDAVDPADATEQRRGVGHAEEDDHR